MAARPPTMPSYQAESVSDAARARELYKYFQPNTADTGDQSVPPEDSDLAEFANLNVHSNIESSKKSSPDTALTAFSQLVAWRLGVQRAMISLIDAETQYFVAESTKTLDLIDNARHGPGDDLWIGCASVEKAGRLCERTIAVQPDKTGEYPSFVVNDLRLDDRFNQLPFVTGDPYLKFYAGVPLITNRGIAIGSLFVVDNRVRNGITKEEGHFLGVMAGTIMRHMEMVREVEEHRRGMKMSRGLASFVEGRSELVEDEFDTGDLEGVSVVGQFESETEVVRSKASSILRSRASSVSESLQSVKSLERKEKEYSKNLLLAEESIMKIAAPEGDNKSPERPLAGGSQFVSQDSVTTTGDMDGTQTAENSPGSELLSEGSALKVLFSRAANLIREAFEVDGGSVFYDAQKGFNGEFREQQTQTSAEDGTGGDGLVRSTTMTKDYALLDLVEEPLKSPLDQTGFFQRTSISPTNITEVLGFSTPVASSIHGDGYPGSPSFSPLTEEFLHDLMGRYPRGKLWKFDGGSYISSSEEDGKKLPSKKLGPSIGSVRRSKRQVRAAAEAKLLLRHFPGVRQLLFVPLWDASRSRWLSANFTWSNELTRILSKRHELAFLSAFGNSIMAQCNRLDTEVSDRKKGDFIGSISHELRSPLHGILASAEFLSDELSDGFTKSLVETIDSCGRTLLDTINHILDFSKINHFQKSWRKFRRPGSIGQKGGAQALNDKSGLSMLNLFASIDVAIVCEEVVEGGFAGHVFQHLTAPSFDRVAEPLSKMSSPRRLGRNSVVDIADTTFQHSDVTIIMDFDYDSYQFTTQPGAFRRIIMNLLGNSLKYTSKGYVRVKLNLSEMEDYQAGTLDAVKRSCISLTISDTGKGISAEFLRSKLFTAFAQENSLSSGTGLGLSIVRGIVASLEGEIQVKSNVGSGTEVKVTLPLLRGLPKSSSSSGSNPQSVSSFPRESDVHIDDLRGIAKGKTVSLWGFDSVDQDPRINQAHQLLKASVVNFLINWYHLTLVDYATPADLVVANEAEISAIPEIARACSEQEKVPAVLILCNPSSNPSRIQKSDGISTVGILAKPVGPRKFGKAIHACLEGVTTVEMTPGIEQDSKPHNVSPRMTGLSDGFDALSISPEGGSVFGNHLMAAGSKNARKAVESPTPKATLEQKTEFPFPGSNIESTTSIDAALLDTSLPAVPYASGSILSNMSLPSKFSAARPIALSTPTMILIPTDKSPRLLLVDDNRINLNLLKTYMRKRKNDRVTEAENGQEAVDAVKATDGFDIIFMDISMPIMDGFEATRQIRQLEKERHEVALSDGRNPAIPALIIALTGLASSRDQEEAMASGVDLFLTKPVSFKEVGKMLDNWEANRESEVGKKEGGAL